MNLSVKCSKVRYSLCAPSAKCTAAVVSTKQHGVFLVVRKHLRLTISWCVLHMRKHNCLEFPPPDSPDTVQGLCVKPNKYTAAGIYVIIFFSEGTMN